MVWACWLKIWWQDWVSKRQEELQLLTAIHMDVLRGVKNVWSKNLILELQVPNPEAPLFSEGKPVPTQLAVRAPTHLHWWRLSNDHKAELSWAFLRIYPGHMLSTHFQTMPFTAGSRQLYNSQQFTRQISATWCLQKYRIGSHATLKANEHISLYSRSVVCWGNFVTC